MPDDGEFRTTIVVVTYNSAALIPAFLDALPGALDGAGPTEVVVVDNDSRDDTLDVVRATRPDATLVALDRNGGYAAGVNAGIQASRVDDAVLVVNPDIRMDPGCVAALHRALRVPGTGVAAPRITDASGRLVHSLRRDATVGRAFGEAFLGGRRARRFAALSQVVGDDSRYQRGGTVEWASGAIVLVSAACRAATGPWDESFFMYSEESEYMLRARERGFSVRYTPEAGAVHLGGDAHTNPQLWATLCVNKLRLFARRNGRLRTLAYHAALLCNEALRSTRPTHRAALRALVRRGAERGKWRP